MIKVPKLIIQVIEEELVSRLQWLIPVKFATFDWPSTLKMDSSYWYCLAESWGREGTIAKVCTISIGMELSLVMQVDTANFWRTCISYGFSFWLRMPSRISVYLESNCCMYVLCSHDNHNSWKIFFTKICSSVLKYLFWWNY